MRIANREDEGLSVQDEVKRRFLVDWMLMKLGRWLRLLGQDVALPAGKSDESLMIQAREECRTIITRDKMLVLAASRRGLPCHLIQANKIVEQMIEMADEGVELQLDPHRCTDCNGLLDETELIRGKAIRWQCRSCKKIYWVGSHWERMENMLEEARSRRGSADD